MQPIQHSWTVLMAGIIVMLGFAALSWLCLFRTDQLQRMAADRLRRWGETPAFNWEMIQSPYYLPGLRLLGFGSGIAALYVGYALIMVLVGR
jgi:hypothetical protein